MFSIKRSSLVGFYAAALFDTARTASIPSSRAPNVGRPIAMTGVSLAASSGVPSSIQDFQDKIYIADIVVGGQSFTVQIDTGSTDLWLLPKNPQSVQLTTTTDFSLVESYGIGQANGTIEFAQLEFAGFTIPSQAFMIATATQDMSIIDSNVCDGMLGLAFQDSFSPLNEVIRQQTNNPNNDDGANAIFNIFEQNPDVPTFFDMQLSRAQDVGNNSSGSFIIGSHINGFENVSTQPKLPVVMPGRWAVPLDQMTVNGKAFTFNQSVVSGVESGKILVDIDSGFSFPPIPSTAVDFIYSSISGSQLIAKSGTWIVPCNGTTDLKFTFGGVDFPMHYLDLTQVNNATLKNKGQNVTVTYCSNTFTYSTPSASDGFDANLGDPFMRNAYVSFNYNGLTTSGEGSFIQMLPRTDFDAALPDFQASRSNSLANMPPELQPKDFVALFLGLEISDPIPSASPSGNAPSSMPNMSATSSNAGAATSSSDSALSTPTNNGGGGKSNGALSVSFESGLRSLLRLSLPLVLGLLITNTV